MMMKNVTDFTTNPLNAFLMIKRATVDIQLITKRFPEESKEFLHNIEKMQPSEEDLAGAVEGLLRLQTVYRLKSESFVNGFIEYTPTRPRLQVHDIFVLGEEAFKLPDQDYFAQEYLILAKATVKNGFDVYKEVDENVMYRYLASSYNRTGDFNKAMEVIEDFESRNPTSKEFKKFKKSLLEDEENLKNRKITLKNPFSDEFVKNGKFEVSKENIIYSQVCRGSLTKTPKEMSQLHCRFTFNSPFTKLAQFKIEEANLDPYIVLFVDVLSSDEVEELKTLSRAHIARASTYSPDLKVQMSKTRIAQTATLSRNHELTKRISRRIEVNIEPL